jgi:hypothetical protein
VGMALAQHGMALGTVGMAPGHCGHGTGPARAPCAPRQRHTRGVAADRMRHEPPRRNKTGRCINQGAQSNPSGERSSCAGRCTLHALPHAAWPAPPLVPSRGARGPTGARP